MRVLHIIILAFLLISCSGKKDIKYDELLCVFQTSTSNNIDFSIKFNNKDVEIKSWWIDRGYKNLIIDYHEDENDIFRKYEIKENIKIFDKSIINKTSFAMGNQDWRHYLNGLYLSIDNTTITSVATDAHRLALSTQNINESLGDPINGIVPRKSINEIAKLLNEDSENITLNLGSNSINVSVAGTTFSSKLIEGKFPDYEQVIPSGESSTLVVDKKNLAESLSRVSVLSSEKYRGVRLVVGEGLINISANNPEQEQGEEQLSCDYSGEKIDIAFNVNYLQEILSSIDESNAEIHFFGSDKSCLITCPGTDDYKYVVMPLLI